MFVGLPKLLDALWNQIWEKHKKTKIILHNYKQCSLSPAENLSVVLFAMSSTVYTEERNVFHGGTLNVMSQT